MSAPGWGPHWRAPDSQAPAPGALAEARIQAHHAAQLVNCVAQTYLEQKPDDSQSNMGWEEALGALCGHVSPGGFRAGLRLRDLTLLLLDGGQTVKAELGLDGQTFAQAQAWLASQLGEHFGQPGALAQRVYDGMPAHPVADEGAAFAVAGQEAALAELERVVRGGHFFLAAAAGERAGAEVRCWPHHFDLGTVVQLEAGDPEHAKSIGIGLSPGDDGIPEPYFYLNPYPSQSDWTLPELAGGGRWASGFTGAVLPLSAVSGAAAAQAQQIQDYYESAYQACQKLLGVKA